MRASLSIYRPIRVGEPSEETIQAKRWRDWVNSNRTRRFSRTRRPPSADSDVIRTFGSRSDRLYGYADATDVPRFDRTQCVTAIGFTSSRSSGPGRTGDSRFTSAFPGSQLLGTLGGNPFFFLLHFMVFRSFIFIFYDFVANSPKGDQGTGFQHFKTWG